MSWYLCSVGTYDSAAEEVVPGKMISTECISAYKFHLDRPWSLEYVVSNRALEELVA